MDGQQLSRLKNLWANFIDKMSEWVFASETVQPPVPPLPGDPKFGEKWENYKWLTDQRKVFHDETSKTIRKIFYMLVGTCLFCVIALSGTLDIQLLTPEATIKLPILNYDIGFQPFLVVGPAVLIALTIYLQIFVGQHRMIAIALESRQPMLPNFNSWTAKLVVLVTFYWMVPVTLAVFAWKAWPHPYGLFYGPFLGVVSFGVAAGLVTLQIRRCPRGSRMWGLPMLIAMFAIFCLLLLIVTESRRLDLRKADLSGKDIRLAYLSRAGLSEANLSEANLSEAILSVADLYGADLSKANLSKANLSGADLRGADLSGADLSGADLSGANLSFADLSFADLYGANLSGAGLTEANLSGADLSFADLSGANLSGGNVTQSQLDKAKTQP